MENKIYIVEKSECIYGHASEIICAFTNRNDAVNCCKAIMTDVLHAIDEGKHFLSGNKENLVINQLPKHNFSVSDGLRNSIYLDIIESSLICENDKEI